MKRYKIDVYSQWGNLVFSSNLLTKDEGSPAEGWNGKFENSNEFVPTGNYIWKATATFKDNSIWIGMEDENGDFRTSGVVTVIQ